MGTLLRMKNKRVIGKASLCDRGLTETRPSLSASARKTREYVQAATGRACTGVLLCLQGCRQGIATHGQREGRQLLMWHPQGTARVHHPGTHTLRCTSATPFLPLSYLLGVFHPEEAPTFCCAPSSRHCASALWETLSTTGLPLCHIGSVNKDVERMNITVSTIPGFGHSLLARGIDGAGGGAVFLLCLAILPLCTKTRENGHRVLPATVLLS